MGRHSAPDDDGGDAGDAEEQSAAVATSPGVRPTPGRHSSPDDDEHEPDGGGLDVIENVLAGDESNTAKITPIVDPILDEPVPAAMTTVIEPVAAADDEQPGKDEKPAKAGKPAKAEEPAKADKPAKGAKAEKPAKAEKRKRPEPHVSDRAILRDDSAARARVIAAVVAPFVIYVVVLIVLGTLDLRTFLIWIWVPLVTAGVVAGLILDLAHRAAAARAIASAGERTPTG